jgi:hypothetical protein
MKPDKILSKYRDLLELSDCLLVINKFESVLYASPQSSKIFGSNKTTLETKKLSDLFEGDGSTIISKAIKDKNFYNPIYVKAKNLDNSELQDIVLILQRYEGIGIGVIDEMLEFSLIAGKIPDISLSGPLANTLSFSTSMVKLFLQFFVFISNSLGGGKIGSSLTLLFIISFMGMSITFLWVKNHTNRRVPVPIPPSFNSSETHLTRPK